MSNELTTSDKLSEEVLNILATGDISRMNADQKLKYINNLCNAVGINPILRPFAFINMNGKLVPYAQKSCTDELRKQYNVSIMVTAREKTDDIYTVTSKAKLTNGREDESIGAIYIKGLRGNDLCNAIMKCETKAKRRVTLSICGLGMLDESEFGTMGVHTSSGSLPSATTDELNERLAKKVDEVEPQPKHYEVEPPEPPPIEGTTVTKPPKRPGNEIMAAVAEQQSLEPTGDLYGLTGYKIPGGRYGGSVLGDLTKDEITSYIAQLTKLKTKPSKVMFEVKGYFERFLAAGGGK